MIDLQLLADKKGIARTYYDVTNQLTYIPEKCRIDALEVLGYPVDDSEALDEKIKKEEIAPFRNILDYVTVINDKDYAQFYIRTPESLGDDENAMVCVSLNLEDGRTVERSMPLEEVEIADFVCVQNEHYDIRRYQILSNLPLGYHQCTVQIKSGKKVLKSIPMSLIVCPSRMYAPKEIEQGGKVWGVSSQLYAVRSKKNWGIGDFDDLKDLLLRVHHSGGQFVGLNPLHAGYPAIPGEDMVSPYSPSSRSFLNVIYISVPSVPELLHCKEALDLIKSEKFQQRLHVLRDKEYVDYRGVLEAKLEVLRLVFDSVKVDDKRSSRGNKFNHFLEQGGEALMSMATYDALQAAYYRNGVDAYSWELLEKEYRDVNSPFVSQWRIDHRDDVMFYCYLQFLAAEQLENAYKAAKADGMMIGIYRDLAVGVAKQSSDVWADLDSVYADKGSIGAPPDPLGPQGQNWGLSPMSPYALKKAAYRPMIRLYRSNMQSCGAIRIDHAAGLYRLWITKLGFPASDGAYVKYDMHDLLGIIALESHRNKCLVIAEDLGTIPPELTKALKDTGAFSYKIFFGERAYDGGYIAPKDYPVQVMSALTTHDMPTLVGWWNCYDLDLGRELGIYTEEEAENLRNIRLDAKQRILDSLHGLGSVSNDFPRNADEVKMDFELAKAMQVHMCRGASSLFSSQIEDWIGVDKPVNVPGTSSEYPNWRRKLTADLDFIFSKKEVMEMTESMTKARAN